MSYQLHFTTDNDSFAEFPRQEIARLLREAAKHIYDANAGKIVDVNGNVIGSWSWGPQ